MKKLAVNGGTPAAGDRKTVRPPWPPVSEAAADRLREIYLSRAWSFNSPSEQKFEAMYAEYHGAAYGIFMANGTVTLECALTALGVGPGDEVVVPGLTWIATAMAVKYVGAKVVFADIDPLTFALDPEAFERAVTPRTRAVIPVHLYGGMADLDRIIAIARRHNIAVVEDCAHMQGGKWNGRGVGSWGVIGSFSFQQSKTLSGGESGICITNDAELADRIYRLKHIGYSRNDAQGGAKTPPPQELCCHNYRGLAIQAVIMEEQIAGLPAYLERCDAYAKETEKLVSDIPGLAFQKPGRLATRQGYYARCVSLEGEFWKGIPAAKFAKAFAAEGMKSTHCTYGMVHKHLLFNLPQKDWRLASCECAERKCANTFLNMHPTMSGEGTAKQFSAIFHKLVENLDELRATEI